MLNRWIEHVWQHVLMCWFASTLRASWRTLHTTDVSPSFRDHALCPEWGSSAHGGLSAWSRSAFAGRLCGVRKSDRAINGRISACSANRICYVRDRVTTRSVGSTADVLRSYRMRWQIELVTLGAGDHVVLRVNSVSRFTNPARYRTATLLAANALFVNQIAQALAEKSRNRLLQLAKWRAWRTSLKRPTDRTCCPSEPALCRVVGSVHARNCRGRTTITDRPAQIRTSASTHTALTKDEWRRSVHRDRVQNAGGGIHRFKIGVKRSQHIFAR